jgi:hypothetical protein
MSCMKKSSKRPRKDVAQSALSVVEQAIGGKLSNGSIEKRKPSAKRRSQLP